jgi:hypothetical protein
LTDTSLIHLTFNFHSFFDVHLQQLAQGYVDVLKLFIVAVKAARERQCLADALVESVNECPVNTAGRPLMPEEIQLRTTWIHAVYLMLNHIEHDADNNDDDNVQTTYAKILPDLVELKQGEGPLITQQFVREHGDALPSIIQEDELQMAIVSQTIKVLWYTLVVLEEERLANDDIDDDPLKVARPQIPRGQDIN